MINAFLRKKKSRVLEGHPWVFRGMIEKIEGDPSTGEQIAVHSGLGKFVGYGLYSSQSEIAIRLYSWNENEICDDSFFAKRIQEAISLRKTIGYEDPKGARRLIFSEGDGLSGWIVDQYGPYLVCQITSGALYSRQELLVNTLKRQLDPKGILLRTPPEISKKEGIAIPNAVVSGEIPEHPIFIREGEVVFQVSLHAGQKTGLYLDQRENHLAVRKLAPNKRVLDLYCYTGGFGLHCAKAGAKEVISVDSSARAVEEAGENAKRNELNQIEFLESDILTFLKKYSGEPFSMVILDPPRFAGTRESVPRALQMYYRVNFEALKLLAPGGILVTSSCSGRVSLEEWMTMLMLVGARSHRQIQALDVRGASFDHPYSLACPETRYLKCLIAKIS